MTSPRPKAAKGMDVEIDPTAKETPSVKLTRPKTKPIHQRATTAVTSSTRSMLLDFRDYSASDVSRRGKSKKDEEDDLVSDYLGMDVSPGINTVVQPPQSYKLPCDHPYAVDFVSETESELPDAWKLIWRDDLLF